jgi:hypothetical protein
MYAIFRSHLCYVHTMRLMILIRRHLWLKTRPPDVRIECGLSSEKLKQKIARARPAGARARDSGVGFRGYCKGSVS